MNIACIHKDFLPAPLCCNRRESSHGKHLGKCPTMHRSYLNWRKIISPKLLLDIKNGTFTRKSASFLRMESFEKEQKPRFRWLWIEFSCSFALLWLRLAQKAIAKHFSPAFGWSTALHYATNWNVRLKATSRQSGMMEHVNRCFLLLLHRTIATRSPEHDCTKNDGFYWFPFSPSNNHFLLNSAVQSSRFPQTKAFAIILVPVFSKYNATLVLTRELTLL